MGLLTCFTPPTLLALPAVIQSSEWQLSSFGSLSASINKYDIVPLHYTRVPLEVYSQNTLPGVFTHLQWMLWYMSTIQVTTSHISTPGKLFW